MRTPRGTLRLGLAAGLAVTSLTVALPTAMAQGTTADVCLEVAAERVDIPAWSTLLTAMDGVMAERSALFPAPMARDATEPDGSSRLLLVDAGHAAGTAGDDAACLPDGLDWGAYLGRVFLDAGADRLLAEAPTTPGIDSSVDITWVPVENRLVTTLVFAGPLDIPNGTCWLDEVLTVDATSARAVAQVEEQGVKTSPFAEGACGRFFEYLPDGGAAGQAASLLPVELEMDDGRRLVLTTTLVSVDDDGVRLGGLLEVR